MIKALLEVNLIIQQYFHIVIINIQNMEHHKVNLKFVLIVQELILDVINAKLFHHQTYVNISILIFLNER